MTLIEYSLFRAKMIRPAQRSFLHDELAPSEIFQRSLEERPSSELRVGQTWHIGNMRMFAAAKGYFAFGRTTKSTNTKFDDSNGNFVEEELETSPYTHVVFDTTIGLLGIASNHRLARNAKGIASKLEKILQGAEIVASNDIDVLIDPISDPDSFLETIKQAFQVMRFTAHFTGPNPLDADEYFQKPLSVYLSKANGTKGKTQIDGEDLNRKTIIEVARSTAATGNKATARVRRTSNQSPTSVGLEGEPLKRGFDESSHDPETVINELSIVYEKVRNDS